MVGSSHPSFDDCGGPFDLTPAHTISSWESQPTTSAETAVISYLKRRPALYVGKTLLHVGIGNGSLFKAIGEDVEIYVGVTISIPELRLFEEWFAEQKQARAILANKHDPREFSRIGSAFDIIVDVNLKSFACCERHFDATITYYASCLKPQGMIVTAESGVVWGWQGNTNVAHTPGAGSNALDAEHRVLGVDGLVQLGARYCLDLAAVTVGATQASGSETLWILSSA
jgi:hypothetical protein